MKKARESEIKRAAYASVGEWPEIVRECVDEIDRLRASLKWVAEMIEQLPSGIDSEADPNDLSPEDFAAHVGGLIWQKAMEAQAEGGNLGPE